MKDEVVSFATEIGAKDLKFALANSEFRSLFKRRNYFLFDRDKYLIIKISRNEIRPFYGLGKDFIKIFNILTEKSGTYYFVALESHKSGWVLSKHQIRNMISNRSLSCSSDEKEYKINNYNLKDQDYFTSVEGFLEKIKG